MWRPPVDGLAVQCDESAHIHNSVLLRAHGHTIGQREHFLYNFPDTDMLIALLPDFNEIGILGEAGRIENHRDSIPVGKFPYFLQVLHTHRLPAGRITGDGDNNHGNTLPSIYLEDILQLTQVQVPFEGMMVSGIACLIDGAVEGSSLTEFYMALGGVEVRIPRYYMAFLHHHRKKYVFGGTALVSGDHIRETGK